MSKMTTATETKGPSGARRERCFAFWRADVLCINKVLRPRAVQASMWSVTGAGIKYVAKDTGVQEQHDGYVEQWREELK